MLEIKDDAIGKELILDLFDCDVTTFTKESLTEFFIQICKEIDMTRTELFFWEYYDDPSKSPEELKHLAGISAVQFLVTSNITVHTFDNPEKCSINLFSCKNFDEDKAIEFCCAWFKGYVKRNHCIIRY